MGLTLKSIQANFTAGEFSPRLLGRVDIEKYYNSLQLCQNMYPFVHGGVTRRPGTYYVAEVKDSSKATRIIPFKFSTTQNYIIEFGNLYMRVYRSRGQVVEAAKTITGITQANPGVVTSALHGYSNADQFYIDSVVGMSNLNGLRFTAAGVAANTLQLSGVDTSGYPAYVSGGNMTRIYTVATPWADTDLAKLKFTQSADTLYVTHPSFQTRKITRTADTSWTVSLFDFKDGPYLPINTSATTITPSATTGAITLTASAALFAATDVGRLVRILSGATWGYAKITGFTSTTVVNATVVNAFGGVAASATWRLGSWSDTTGWPGVIAFYQQRLYLASTTTLPQTVWGSVSGDFENFQPSAVGGTVSDSDGVNFTISDDQVNAIEWMTAGKVLNIGTREGEYSLYGGNVANGAPVTPTNISVSRESNYGSAVNVPARRIGNSVLFVQPSKRRMRELEYDYRVDAYQARDLTLLAEHITNTGIIDFTYQKDPDSIGWMARTDGLLVGFTYDKIQDVLGFHRHVIGGTSTKVESIAVIPNPSATGEDLWMVVSRTINGSTRRYIEYVTDPFDPDTNGQDSAFFVDAGLTYDGYLNATLTPGALTGTGITFTAGSGVFTTSMVGRKIKAANGGRATITGYTSATQVVCTITTDFPSLTVISSGGWSVAIKNLTGLAHLEGQSVEALGDGSTMPDMTVVSGAIALDDFYSYVNVGLGSVARIKTQTPELQVGGSVQGAVKGTDKVYVRCYQSGAFKFGPDFDNLEQTISRDASDDMDTAPPLMTGLEEINWNGSYQDTPEYCFQQSQALPMTLLSLTKRLTVYG